MSKVTRRHACVAMALAALAGCGGDDGATVSRPPRPVTVTRLREQSPLRQMTITGSVEPWMEDTVGFEVPGRILHVVEQGTAVTRMPAGDELRRLLDRWVAGKTGLDRAALAQKPWVIAVLDPARYRAGLNAVRAQLEGAKAQDAALAVEIEEVLVARRAAASAQLAHARIEYESLRKLFEARGAGRRIDVDRARAAFESAAAGVRQIDAGVKAKKAERSAMAARIAQLTEAVAQARLDLEKCLLIAPFPGQVGEVHVAKGGIVAAGAPVARLTMMSPLRVAIAVSAETDRKIEQRASALVLSPWGDEPERAYVEFKDTAADPRTRTFRVTVLIQNRKVVPDLAQVPGLANVTRAHALWPLVEQDPGAASTPLMALERTIQRDDTGRSFVWHVEDTASVRLGRARQEVVKGRLRKVFVTLGRRTHDFAGVYRLQEVTDAGGLTLEDLVAEGLSQPASDGDPFVFYRERWLFRPGDLVPVVIGEAPASRGFFAPMNAIVAEGATHRVFVVEGDATDAHAEAVEVAVGESYGEFRRIESPRLGEGTRLVLEGAHYLLEGEKVQVIEVKEVSL